MDEPNKVRGVIVPIDGIFFSYKWIHQQLPTGIKHFVRTKGKESTDKIGLRVSCRHLHELPPQLFDEIIAEWYRSCR